MSMPKKMASIAKSAFSAPTSKLRRANEKKTGRNRPKNTSPHHFEASKSLLKRPISDLTTGNNPYDIYNTIESNIRTGKFQSNFEIAERINTHPNRVKLVQPRLFLLLLESLAAEKKQDSAPLAMELVRELANFGCSEEELKSAFIYLYQCFEKCDDFTQLLSLKIIYQSILAGADTQLNIIFGYLACHMRVLLNTGQVMLALNHFDNCLDQFKDSEERSSLLEILPINKLLKALCSEKDCEGVLTVVNEMFVTKNCASEYDWSEVLGLALSKNDYNLVKLIYTNVIMQGIDFSLPEEIILNGGPHQINLFLSSLSETTLQHILHTFAMNGDVSSCLRLIEWHYIHKSMKGEKALTKELCLEVTRAYCYHVSTDNTMSIDNGKDGSAKTVLDVIENFVSRNRHDFNYTDFVDALSHRFSIFNAPDYRVENASKRETTVRPTAYSEPFISGEELPEEVILLEKKSNRNAHISTYGSVLKNKEILSEFIVDHLGYIFEKQHSPTTRRIFTNCLLTHLATHQNTTGITIALEAMASLDESFVKETLDSSSYDIIIHSFSKSPAAMATGLAFYHHMKQAGKHISAKNYKCFILSSLRGDAYNQLLEFYVFEYLSSTPQFISTGLLQRIRSFKRLNDEGRFLLKVLEDYRPSDGEKIDKIWDFHSFTKNDPIPSSSDSDEAEFYKIDQRDRIILEKVLSSG